MEAGRWCMALHGGDGSKNSGSGNGGKVDEFEIYLIERT